MDKTFGGVSAILIELYSPGNVISTERTYMQILILYKIHPTRFVESNSSPVVTNWLSSRIFFRGAQPKNFLLGAPSKFSGANDSRGGEFF